MYVHVHMLEQTSSEVLLSVVTTNIYMLTSACTHFSTSSWPLSFSWSSLFRNQGLCSPPKNKQTIFKFAHTHTQCMYVHVHMLEQTSSEVLLSVAATNIYMLTSACTHFSTSSWHLSFSWSSLFKTQGWCSPPKDKQFLCILQFKRLIYYLGNRDSSGG